MEGPVRGEMWRGGGERCDRVRISWCKVENSHCLVGKVEQTKIWRIYNGTIAKPSIVKF